MSILLIDIGNTDTSVGLASTNRIRVVGAIPTDADQKRAAALVVRATRKQKIDGAVISSVVPAVTRDWTRIVRSATGRKPLVVTHRTALNIDIDYPRPESIGADRLANACGAVMRYGAPVVVADFGTALTFDIVSPRGAYVGGVIAPGLALMTDYLAEKTALLPRVQLRRHVGAVGKSTRAAMCIGAELGYRGMVREILGEIRRDMGVRALHVCATGGHANWALQGSRLAYSYDPDLTLFGLRCIYEASLDAE